MTDAIGVPEAARCLGCDYALRGLPTYRCPECGRAFDPAKPWTVRLPATEPPPRRFTPQQTRALTAWAVTATVVSLTLDFTVSGGVQGQRGLPIAVVSSLVANHVRRLFEPERSRSERWRSRIKWSAAYLLVLLFASRVVHSTCIHGTLWGVAGVGVARSSLGGPCRNDVICTHCRRLSDDWYLWWQE